MAGAGTTSGPAILEKAARASIAILDAAVRKALIWAGLGAAIGVVAVVATQFVVRLAQSNGASIGSLAIGIVSGTIVAISALIFGAYGGQIGAVEGAIGVEPELGILRATIDLALADVRARFGARFVGAGVEDVDDLAIAGTRKVLGAPDASWKGPFGVVARIVFRVVSGKFEGRLRAVLMEETGRAGATSAVELDAVAARIREGFVDDVDATARSVLRVEFTLLVAGVFTVALLWYPLAARVLSILRR